MKVSLPYAAVCGFLFSSTLALSQTVTTWNDGGADSDWENAANWSAGVPTGSDDAVIATQPTDNLIGFADGSTVETGSLTFTSALTASVELQSAGVSDALQVNGDIANLDDNGQTFSLPVTAGADATYTIGGGLTFDTLSLGTSNILVSGGSLTVVSQLVIDINSPIDFGTIGSTDVSGATINIASTSYTGNLGDVFDFTTGSFAGATLGTLPALSGSLEWDTSDFASSGVLTVVPEPSTWALIVLGGFASTLLFRRRSGA